MDLTAIEDRIKKWESEQYSTRRGPCSRAKLVELRAVMAQMGMIASQLEAEVDKPPQAGDEIRTVVIVGLNQRLLAVFKLYEVIYGELSDAREKKLTQQ